MKRAAWVAMLAMGAAPAFAATQGESGPRSAGSILITASVAAQARLAGTAVSPCVALNTATQMFGVTADPADRSVAIDRCGTGARTGLAQIRTDGLRALVVAPE